MIRKTGKYFFFILIPVILVACLKGKNIIFTDTAVIPDEVWSLDQIPQFKVDVKDTVSFNNIILSVRTGTSYPFRNLWLFVTTTAPTGLSVTDTIEYNLADEKGEWYGKGVGDIHQLDLPYRLNVFFPVKGYLHRFSLPLSPHNYLLLP